MRVNRKVLITSLMILPVLAFVISVLLRSSVPRYNPSSTPAYIPQSGDDFAYYVEQNRERIRSALIEYYFQQDDEPFGPRYSLDDVVDMRSPYQLLPSGEECGNELDDTSKGFLLVHGLSDSPYLLRNVANSLAAIYPCATMRGLLSPGHGTIPGDLYNVRLEQWYAAFEYGIQSFSELTDQLYVVGYSNGSALALQYLDNNRNDNPITKLILLSPGLKTADDRAFLTPYIKYYLQWIVRKDDRDAVKYESFPTNAAAEFYKLTSAVISQQFLALDVPALMVVSGDDTTIDYRASVSFFCQKLPNTDNRLVLYRSSYSDDVLEPECDRVQLRESTADIDRFISYSHVALTTPIDDPHYGMDGNYPACLAHDEYPDRFQRCLTDNENSVYAENNYMDENGLFDGKIVRRTSFNPDYDEMIADIQCFIDPACQL